MMMPLILRFVCMYVALCHAKCLIALLILKAYAL